MSGKDWEMLGGLIVWTCVVYGAGIARGWVMGRTDGRLEILEASQVQDQKRRANA